jgi:hypothetical protein
MFNWMHRLLRRKEKHSTPLEPTQSYNQVDVATMDTPINVKDIFTTPDTFAPVFVEQVCRIRDLCIQFVHYFEYSETSALLHTILHLHGLVMCDLRTSILNEYECCICMTPTTFSSTYMSTPCCHQDIHIHCHVASVCVSTSYCPFCRSDTNIIMQQLDLPQAHLWTLIRLIKKNIIKIEETFKAMHRANHFNPSSLLDTYCSINCIALLRTIQILSHVTAFDYTNVFIPCIDKSHEFYVYARHQCADKMRMMTTQFQNSWYGIELSDMPWNSDEFVLFECVSPPNKLVIHM